MVPSILSTGLGAICRAWYREGKPVGTSSAVDDALAQPEIIYY